MPLGAWGAVDLVWYTVTGSRAGCRGGTANFDLVRHSTRDAEYRNSMKTIHVMISMWGLGLVASTSFVSIAHAGPLPSSSGAEIFDLVTGAQPVGSFPRVDERSVVVDSAGQQLVFGTGGVPFELLWRHPVQVAKTTKSGDTVQISATIDWEMIDDPVFESELVIALSDGGRLMGSSFGLDGGVMFDVAILHDECDFGSTYVNLFEPGDRNSLPIVMPITIDVSVGPEGSVVVARNGNPLDAPVAFPVEWTLDVTQPLDLVVGVREGDLATVGINRAEMSVQTVAGAARDKWTLMLREDVCSEIVNSLPDARCQALTLPAHASTCDMCDVNQLFAMDDGSFDVDGHGVFVFGFEPDCLELGTTQVTMEVRDPLNGADTCTAPVTVVDETPPALDLMGEDLSLCLQSPSYLQLVAPDAVDTCAGDIDIEGRIVAIDGVALPAAIELDANFGAVLREGSVEVLWQATDAAGNTVSASEVIDIDLRDDLAGCCGAGGVTINGTGGGDFIYRTGSTDFHVNARGGQDFVGVGRGDDCILGGSGGDAIHVGGGLDRVWSGSGADAVYCGGSGGQLSIDAGPGDDAIYASSCGASVIHAGLGNDTVHGSSADMDTIAPGAGADRVYAEGGDDTIRLYAECELTPGKLLDGGPGSDTLFSPVPEAELVAAGISLVSIETVVVDTSNTAAAVCP